MQTYVMSDSRHLWGLSFSVTPSIVIEGSPIQTSLYLYNERKLERRKEDEIKMTTKKTPSISSMKVKA